MAKLSDHAYKTKENETKNTENPGKEEEESRRQAKLHRRYTSTPPSFLPSPSPKSHRIVFADAARTDGPWWWSRFCSFLRSLAEFRPPPHTPPAVPMKITAILVLKSPGDASASASSTGGEQPVVLANASDVSRFGFFQRPAAREFIVFVARTVALRTAAGSRQTVQHEGTPGDQLFTPFSPVV